MKRTKNELSALNINAIDIKKNRQKKLKRKKPKKKEKMKRKMKRTKNQKIIMI